MHLHAPVEDEAARSPLRQGAFSGVRVLPSPAEQHQRIKDAVVEDAPCVELRTPSSRLRDRQW